MSGLYVIPLSGLKEGHYSYDFDIDKKFFEQFEESEIKDGNLHSNVAMEKRSSHIDMRINITGTVRISCDRCLDMFSQPVESANRVIIKYSSSIPDDSDPDMITIAPNEPELDIKQYLYEFICLALPIQRIHPDDQNGRSTCNPEMLKKINEHVVHNEQESDSRWDELKKLMNNN
jgi:uncharacterized protein